MNLKFETIVQIFRKIIELNAVTILKNSNEYYQKTISKSVRKMDLYPALAVIILESTNEYYRNFFLRKRLQNGPLSCYVY